MSEPLLKALLRLFAYVAYEDDVTTQERDQIRAFLEEHLSQKSVAVYLTLFDEYIKAIPAGIDAAGKLQAIEELCAGITRELTRKQKVIIILELVRIIMADGSATEREEMLVQAIAKAFRIPDEDATSIKAFVMAREASGHDRTDTLIIAEDREPWQRAHFEVRNNLDGFIAVLQVPVAEMYFVTYHGKSGIYLNGMPVKSGSIHVLAVGSTLRWENDDPVYFGDVLNHFKNFGAYPRTSFEAHGISYKFKNGKIGLREIELAEESGTLIALMGASGAGKSTLLHVLNGSEKPSAGTVLINGIDIHREPARIEGVIGFVPQDDLLIEDLTVYQNLFYAASLCFGDKAKDEIDALVMRVLTDLGLEETKDLKVGSPLNKTISGGQRKRLNIGLELLREPAVLFCDEPTSGLSSRDSENIIDLLKELSLKGKLVFAVIHQPSSDIFKMFDKLLVLDTGGYQIYYGNPVDSIRYFKQRIDLVNSSQGECVECGNVNPEQVFNIIETKVINEYGHFTNERKISPARWREMYKTHQKPVYVETSTETPHSTLRIPKRIRQAILFGLRDIQAKLHNRQYLIINLLEAPVLAFILAFIVRYFNEDDETVTGYLFGKNLNMPAYFFMSVIVALFMGLTVSAEEIIRDRKILKREAFLHLSRSSYIFSKIGILFLLSAIQTLSFVLVGSYILEIKGTILQHWFILFTASCFANLLGLNISSGFNSAVTIYILIPLLLIPQLILSGVVVKFDKLNPAIGNSATVPFVGDLMVSRWAFEAAMVMQFKDNPFEREFYMYDRVMANADYKKVYFIPAIETKLQYCLNNFKSDDAEEQLQLAEELDVLRIEVNNELKQMGAEDVLNPADLTVEGFDSAAYNRLVPIVEQLKTYYVRRFNKADELREAKIYKLTSTQEKEEAFNKFREAYHNESITNLVKNYEERHRIIEKDGRLIQKVFPIYKNPEPDHMVDFDAQFYMPEKHFLRINVDTFYFNLAVIWSMTLVLSLTLYFDVLKKVIDGLDNISNPLYRRK